MDLSKFIRFLPEFLFLILITTLSSCSVVTGIFKAGMGFGIFLVLLVVVVIIVIVVKAGKK